MLLHAKDFKFHVDLSYVKDSSRLAMQTHIYKSDLYTITQRVIHVIITTRDILNSMQGELLLVNYLNPGAYC